MARASIIHRSLHALLELAELVEPQVLVTTASSIESDRHLHRLEHA